MGRLALSLTIVAWITTPAHAEVVVEAGVPFTVLELVDALALRGTAADDVVVRAVSSTAVELRTAIGSQRVELGVARGATAARIVALQLAALSVEPEVVEGPARPAAVGVPATDTGWTLGVNAGGGHGIAAIDFALTTVRADVMLRHGPWRWGGSVGWLRGLTKTPDSTTAAGSPVPPNRMDLATADLGVVRAAAGLAAGRLEVVAGPELVPYRVSATSPGVTVGAGGSIRVRLIGGLHWQAIASAELDGFLHRVIVERDGVQFAATPRVALTAAVGLAWSGP